MWILVLVISSVGCAAQTGEVSGAVSLNGKPLVSGSVAIFGPDGLPHVGPIRSEGKFTVKKIPVGLAKVSVHSPLPQPWQKVTGWFPIPDRYTNAVTSGLTIEVQTGMNSYNIQLTDQE